MLKDKLMREIKFRVWDIKGNRWVEKDSFLVSPQYGGIMPWFDNNEVGTSLSDVELMQYTGLKDKNGKEIYEGDIVKFQMTRRKLVEHPIMTAFEDETAIYQGSVKWGDFGWRPFIDGEVKECEIIGNIYQSPELTT